MTPGDRDSISPTPPPYRRPERFTNRDMFICCTILAVVVLGLGWGVPLWLSW